MALKESGETLEGPGPGEGHWDAGVQDSIDDPEEARVIFSALDSFL